MAQPSHRKELIDLNFIHERLKQRDGAARECLLFKAEAFDQIGEAVGGLLAAFIAGLAAPYLMLCWNFN